MRLLPFISLVLLSCVAFGAEKSMTLSNGLRVVVISDHSAPIVAHGVFYNVGSFDDPMGKAGMAHLLEHLMFGPTSKHAKGNYAKFVSSMGGRMNAYTSVDRTFYYAIVRPSALDDLMAFEADRMRGVVYSDVKSLAAEREVVLGELVMRNNVASRAMDAMALEMNYDYQYKRPVIGYESDLNTVNTKDLQDFYDMFYMPDNAILIVVGDVNPDNVFAKAKKHFGGLGNPSSKPNTSYFTEVSPNKKAYFGAVPKCCSAKVVELKEEQEKQSSVSFLISVAGELMNSGGDTSISVGLKVLAHALGAYSSGGRLQSALLDNSKLAKSVSVDIGGPYIFINAVPEHGVSLDKLSSEIGKILIAVSDGGLNDVELKSAHDFAKLQAGINGDGIINKFMSRAESMRGGASWSEVIDLMAIKDNKTVNSLVRQAVFAGNDMVYAKVLGK